MKTIKELLTNEWMNSSIVLAQIAHVLFSYATVMTVAYFTGTSLLALGITAAVVVAYAAVKEFWYDANFELPVQTAFDNWLDFSMFCLGLVLGFGVASIGLIK